MAEGEMRFDSNANTTTQFRFEPSTETAAPIDINERVEEMAEQMQVGRNFRFKSTLSTTEPQQKDPTSIKKQQSEIQEYDTPTSTPTLPKPRLGVQPNHTEENISDAPTNPAVIQARTEKLANMPISMLKQLPIFMNTMIEQLKEIDQTLDEALNTESSDEEGGTTSSASSTASSPSDDISELGKALSSNHSSRSLISDDDNTDVGNLGNGGREDNSYSFVPPSTLSSSSSTSSTTNSELEFYDDAKVSAFDVMKEISDSMLAVMTQLYNFEGVDATKMSDLAVAAKDMAVTQIQEFQNKLEAVKKKMEKAQEKAKKNKKIMDAVKWTMVAVSILAVPFSGGMSMMLMTAALAAITVADSQTGFMKDAVNGMMKGLTKIGKEMGLNENQAENLALAMTIVTVLIIAAGMGRLGASGESVLMKAVIGGGMACTVAGMGISSSDVVQERFKKSLISSGMSKEDADIWAPIILSSIFMVGSLICMGFSGRADKKTAGAGAVKEGAEATAQQGANRGGGVAAATGADATGDVAEAGSQNKVIVSDSPDGVGAGKTSPDDPNASTTKAESESPTTSTRGTTAEGASKTKSQNKQAATKVEIDDEAKAAAEAKEAKIKAEKNTKEIADVNSKSEDAAADATRNQSKWSKIKESLKKANEAIEKSHASNSDGTMSKMTKMKMAAEAMEISLNAMQSGLHYELAKIYEQQAQLIGEEGNITEQLTYVKGMLKSLQESLQRQGSGIDELSQAIVFVKNNIDDLWRKGGQALNFSGM